MNPRLRYLTTSLALLAAGGAYAWSQAPTGRAAPGLPRPPAASRPANLPAAPVSARGVLDRRIDLGLTVAQVSRLEALDRHWSDETAVLHRSVEAAREDLAGFMSTQAGQRTPLAEIEGRSAEYRSASAELRARRRRHAEATLEVLTESQRRALGPATTEPNGERR